MINIGYRHDRLEVIEELNERYHGQRVYLCRCDCGNVKKIPSGSIDNTSSCGCLSKEMNKRTFNDLTGKRFGMLTVIKRNGNDNPIKWDCECDCGNKIIQFGGNLVSKKKRRFPLSCGCANKYFVDLTGNKFGLLTVVSYAGLSKKYHATMWKCYCICGNTKVIPANNLMAGKINSCGCADHVEGTSISSITQKLLNKNNTSGKRGVYYNASRSKWCAAIVFKRKNYYLGSYERKEDAVIAREMAEEKLYRDFLDWYYSTYPERKLKTTSQ